MNEQIYQLLMELLSEETSVYSMDQLSELYHVSNRTIRSYLIEIDDFLNQHRMPVVLERKGGRVRFIGNKEQAKQIMGFISETNYYEYKLTAKERQIIMKLEFLTADRPVKLAEFESLLYISRGTVKKDLVQVSKYFKLNNIHFNENVHKGLFLDIDEVTTRMEIYQVIKSLKIPLSEFFNPANHYVCGGYVRHKINLDIYYESVKAALNIAERHFRIIISDYEFYRLLVIICIMRTRFGKGIMVSDASVHNLSYDKNSLKVANYLMTLLFQDKNYFPEHIFLAHSLTGRIHMPQSSEIAEDSMNLYIIIKSFLYQLSNEYHLNLYQDAKLQEFLAAHIMGICKRYQNREELSNPYKDQLMQEYPKDYEKLKNNIGILEDNLGFCLNDDEITYVLMHILATVERMHSNRLKPNIIILCNTGMGTSHFLAENVKKHFKVNIVELMSSHRFKQSLLSEEEAIMKECDFIISTIPLMSAPVPWIQVNPLMTGEDINKIHDLIKEVNLVRNPNTDEQEKSTLTGEQLITDISYTSKEPYILENHHELAAFLPETNVLLDKTAINWKDAIIIAAEPLLWENKITSNYIRAIVNNVLDNGPYFVIAHGVAVAHANPAEGALEMGITFTRFADPVYFGHKEYDPVQIIVTLSLVNTKKYLNIIMNIMNILCTQSTKTALMQSKTYQEILEVFQGRC